MRSFLTRAQREIAAREYRDVLNEELSESYYLHAPRLVNSVLLMALFSSLAVLPVFLGTLWPFLLIVTVPITGLAIFELSDFWCFVLRLRFVMHCRELLPEAQLPEARIHS